jgi:uncharacterized protein with HEPN domain
MTDSGALMHLDQMLEAAEHAIATVEGMDELEFLNDTVIQKAVAMNLVIVGEAVSRLLKEHVDLVSRHPEIEWRAITSMRNRIAHGYSSVDFKVVWSTTQEGLPQLARCLPAIIRDIELKYPSALIKPTPES